LISVVSVCVNAGKPRWHWNRQRRSWKAGIAQRTLELTGANTQLEQRLQTLQQTEQMLRASQDELVQTAKRLTRAKWRPVSRMN
jgi:C4-dicarboxylate-specific signal transduction histidine kinase